MHYISGSGQSDGSDPNLIYTPQFGSKSLPFNPDPYFYRGPDPVNVRSDPVNVRADPINVRLDPVNVRLDPVDLRSDPVISDLILNTTVQT